jgi:nitrous oxidase accessory protein NosD
VAATPEQQVRTLTGLDATELTDDNIAALLEVNGGIVKLAAAGALEVLAGQLITAVQSDDISLDGSKRAAVLMARAGRLREQAAAEAADGDDGFFFDIVTPGTAQPELTERGWW